MAQNRKSQGRSKKNNNLNSASRGQAKRKPNLPGGPLGASAAPAKPAGTAPVRVPETLPTIPAGLLGGRTDPAMESLEQRMLLSVSGFKPATPFDTGAGPKAVISGDFNGDGKTDLITVNQTENDLTFLAGDGHGSFATGTTFTAGTGPRAVVAADFNGDGKLDLAVANQGGNNVSILLGNGSGGFTLQNTTYTTGSGPVGIAVADVNADGKLDLITANSSSNNVSVLRGNGDGTFNTATNYAAGVQPTALAVGDFNHDGRPDLIVADTAGGLSELVNSSGTFGSPLTMSLASGSSPKGIVIGDFNGDGNPDVAVANSGANVVGIFTGKGSSLFNAVHTYAAGTTPSALAMGDFNGDSKLDLAVTDQGGANVTVLPGVGDGSFGTAASVAVGTTPVAIAAVDLNNDQKIDLAVANKDDSTVSVLLDKVITATARAQSTTAGAALAAVMVGSFSDTEANTVAGDYTAVITWGDGTTSAGTVSANGGSFDVKATHTYHQQGVYTMTVAVADTRGYAASATARATIGDAPITAAGATLTDPVEGAIFNETVATFTDANPYVTADQFSAAIDWGDGAADSGVVTSDGHGGFIVTGSHAYTTFGAESATVVILHDGGSDAQAAASISVADAPLHLAAGTVSATEGSQFSGTVAHFTDDNPFGTEGDYTAVITWGDGTTSAGAVSANDNGGFDISGTHTYDHAGGKTVRVDVADTGGSAAHDSHAATVANATLASTGGTFTATEGIQFNGAPVAHFTDSNSNATHDDFTAVIHWGDGFTSAGVIAAANGGGFDVTGPAHTYSHAGGKTVTVNITGAGGGTTAATTAATVNDNVITVTGSNFTATEGHTFAARLVANFSDANAAATSGDFSAVIHWGDGVTSAGAVSSDGSGGFNVVGGHKYLHAGAHTVTIDVTGAGGSTTSNTANATVNNDTITVSAPGVSAVEGSQFSGTVASFTDANAAATMGDFTAVIDWGDGSTSAAMLSAGVGGAFNVNGVHTYAEDGTPTVAVTVTGLGSGTGTNSHAAAVADAALHSTGHNITATEGTGFTGALVASFTDDDPNGTAADYTAVITWGDGSTSNGSIQANGNGGFDVLGDHSYDHAGGKTLSVAIADEGGSISTAGSHATVNDATIAVTSSGFTAMEGTSFAHQLVGNFTDSNAHASPSDFSAVIHWGDGTTSSGTVSGDGNGGFNVHGAHKYAHAGNKTFTIDVTGAGGSTTSSDPATATVHNAALSSTGNQVIIGAIEGVGNVGMLTAHFTDANTLATKGDFSAVIHWGDGTTDTGTISDADGGGFDVKGDHTWYHTGDKTITVDITGAGGGTTQATTAVGVDSEPLMLTGHDFSVTEGSDTGTTTVASFSDPNTQAVGADFSAVIHWGDGTTSAGTVVDNGGGTFDVTGAHTYDHAGAKDVVVDVIAASTDTFHVGATATVNDALVTVTANTFTRTEGETFTGQLVGHFTDANANASSGDFTALIHWGDGTTGFGSVADHNGGGFDVSGGHQYAHAGDHTVTVTVTGAGGSVTTSNGVTATVSNDTITAAPATLTVTEGAAFTGKVLATFTDHNSLATAGDFAAVITWGDGTTSDGVVQDHNGGGFEVIGGHSYGRSGDKNISVAITGHGNGGDTAASTAHVHNATLAGDGQDITGVEGHAIIAPVVATFTDSNPGAQAADFSAVIDWGDGSTEAGVVTLDSGVFSVTGADHTYTRSGDKTVTSTITGAGGGTLAPSATAHVHNDTLTASAHDFTVTEGASFHNALVATFADANAGATADDFTAVIHWGDGTSSDGTVQDHTGGGFEVVGAHQYAHAGTAHATVDIFGAGGGTTSASPTVTVNNAVITATPKTISAVEGTAFTAAVVATFTDANNLATAGDFNAVITWGDATTSDGTVQAHTGGGFEVIGSHTYGRSGDKSISVAITGHGNGGDTAASTAHVGNQTLTAAANDFTTTEGASFTGQLVATFTDANTLAQAADFSAVIIWGDGATSVGTVQAHNGGGFEVVGDHSYDHAGDKALTLDILGAGGGTAEAHPAATVNDATIAVTANDFTATEGTGFVNKHVATFTDSNASATKDDFTAIVTWGDGTTSAGAIADHNGGGFDVLAGHNYAHAGDKTFTVAVTGAGGSINPSGNGTATVHNAAITAAGATLTATEASEFTGVVGTFTDANPGATAGDFGAVIDWGDGTTSVGTVHDHDGGGFEVQGTHTYTQHGSLTVHFTATGAGGGSDAADSTMTVADRPITATGQDISGTEGSAINGAVVATFDNGNPDATANEFVAVITWGDGATSDGTVQAHNGGGFEVVGDHTYNHAGGKTVGVEILSDGGSDTTVTSSATVANAAIATTSQAVSATENQAINGATVANFTDANTHASAGDFSALVDWGDGHTSAGTAVDNGGGQFGVTASHTYLHAGHFTVTTTVAGADHVGHADHATAAVAASIFGSGATNVQMREGTLGNALVLGDIQSNNPHASTDDFTAVIDWGDGTTSNADISVNTDFNGAGSDFFASAAHNYAHAGVKATTVTFRAADGTTHVSHGHVNVTDATITVTATPLSGVTEGVAFSGQAVASFTDANGSASAADFTAVVDWGDGTTGAGSVVDNHDGTFGVTGGHTFSDPGPSTVTVTVTGAGGSHHADHAAVSIASTLTGITAATGGHVTEGAGQSITVASFTDANTTGGTGDFTAVINWGDGTTTAGTIGGSTATGNYTVSGSHAYDHAGSKATLVTVTAADHATISDHGQISVDDAAITVTGTDFTVTEGTSFSGTAVAHFTDANVHATRGDFSAVVTWGDGSTSGGTIANHNGGGFDVLGDHTYLHAGTQNVTVAVTGAGGSTHSNASPAVATIHNAPLASSGKAITATEGTALTGALVASFSDSNLAATADDFSAVIHWGDGSTSAGAIAANGDLFDVTGPSHTYAHSGPKVVTVDILGAGGGTTQAVGSAAVANATLASSGHAIGGTENAAIAAPLVASFTDSNANATFDDFSAVIHWGDGSTSAGVITASGGGFDVTGPAHTYLHSGNKTVTVDITGNGGGTTQATATATVANATLASSAHTFTATEGTAFTGALVASFTDSNSHAVAADFAAVITWGDASTSAGTIVDNGSGHFDVTGDHTYQHAGTKSFSVLITGAGGGTTTAGTSATVLNALLTASGTPFTVVEGASFGGVQVAHFTDANTGAAAGDFSALITWGDGSTSAGMIAAGGNGFDVTGSHQYAHAGNKNVSVAVTGAGNGTASASTTATVNNDVLAVTGHNITPTEGVSFTGSLLTTFTDANALATANDFSALITWGDGTTAAGVIASNGSGFDVTGPAHTYAHSGDKTFTVAVSGHGGGAASDTATASVGNALITVSGKTVTGVEGNAITGGLVATFTDANAAAAAGDFSATIDWGDGSTSAGTIAAANGAFNVTGTHTYAQPNTYTTTVSILGNGGGTASNTGFAVVSVASINPVARNITGTAGAAFSGSVAGFTDANPSKPAGDFVATVNWGDGTSVSTATVTAVSPGVFDVTAGHTYQHAGSFLPVVTLTPNNAPAVTISSTMHVADAALTAAGTAVTAIEGQSLSGVTVATFSDANPYAGAGNFSAVVTWGDGATSVGTVASDGGSGFVVTGTHTYSHAGSKPVSVAILSDGGATVSTTATATIGNATLTGTAGSPINAIEGATFTGTVASFSDANTDAVATDFHAVIHWGDGSTTNGAIVANADGGFDVLGNHKYLHSGNKSITVDITGNGGGATSGTDTAVVANASLHASGKSVAGTEGAVFTGTLASFTDSNTSASGGDFSAVIDWGDGQTSAGAIVDNGTGHFDVTGTHTWAHAGGKVTGVSILGAGGGTVAATGSATVANARLGATSAGFTAVEGAAFTGKLVASFTDSNVAASGADFHALITWGDGQTSAGTIVDNGNGHFDVTGDHTYARSGSKNFTVDVTGNGSGTAHAAGSAAVGNAALTATGTTLTATEGTILSGVVASFTDANPAAVGSDFSAILSWGDGQTSAGTVVDKGAGHFDVTGSHTYDHAGGKTLSVAIPGVGGGTASAPTSVTVGNNKLDAAGHDITAAEGSPFTGKLLASFTDANSAASGSDFSAVILWGDGQTSAGTIVDNGNGHFDVTGDHTYLHAGAPTFMVTFSGRGGGHVAATGMAHVGNASLDSAGQDLTATEGTAVSNVQVATFTDSNTAATGDDFSAVITWGDGITSPGTIVDNGGGSFAVLGSHSYLHAGKPEFTVDISGKGQGVTTATGTATVSNAALAATGNKITAIEGTPFSGVVASFTDANTHAGKDDFSAVITWGDGQTSVGTIVDNGTGHFDVTGTHLYSHGGPLDTAVDIAGHGGGAAHAAGSVAVGNATLTAAKHDLALTEGVDFNGVVASFTDSNTAATADDFSATINWGDGTSTDVGTIVDNGNGHFDVTGEHTYAHAAREGVTVDIRGNGGGTARASDAATVSNAMLSAAGVDVSAVEGTPLDASTVVATFSDPNVQSGVDDFTAVITWGDGSTSAGVISGDAGSFSVAGGHTYNHSGDKKASVAIAGKIGGAAVANFTAPVDNADLSVTANPLSATEGTAMPLTTVASFTDVNTSATRDDFHAVIDWGDGSTSLGTIVGTAPGQFDVRSSHTFAHAGGQSGSVTITGNGGGTASDDLSTTVANAAITVTGRSITATEGAPFTGAVVASFHSASSLATGGDFSAVISWGDGSTSVGSISPNGSSFDVAGDHTYNRFGNKQVSVTVTGLAKGTASGAATAHVSHAALSGSGKQLTATEGSNFTGTVASFTDANPVASDTDFSAVITWGDGSTSAGKVVKTDAGRFDVTGSHKFLHAGSKSASVSITDGAASTSATSAVLVGNAAISAKAASPKAVEGTPFSGLVATFTSANPAAVSTDFSATITWADGSTSAGSVGAAAGVFTVMAKHTFRLGGNQGYTVAVTGNGGGTASVVGNARVTVVPLSAIGATVTKATRGSALSATIATFTDANATALNTDFNAVINWGDGTTSVGSVQSGVAAGSFKVVGTHTYNAAANYTPVVTISDNDGPTATAKGVIKVSKPVASPRGGRHRVGGANGGPTAHELHLAHEAHVQHLAHVNRHPQA